MFSSEPRCVYRRNPLAEVICQFRFPEIPALAGEAPDEFHNCIRGDFPCYDRLREVSTPILSGLPGNPPLPKPSPTVNHRFLSADGKIKVNLTSRFISVSTTAYTCWEDFAPSIDKPLAEFIRLYQPQRFDRVGLRYMNFISRRDCGLEGAQFRWLICAPYLGPLGFPQVKESDCLRCSVDTAFSLPGGCHVKIHAGPGRVTRSGVPDNEVKFIFDQDLFKNEPIPVNTSIQVLQTLHSHAYPIFRGAITDLMHNQFMSK